MSTFDEMLDDFVAYPKNNLVLEIIDVLPSSGDAINEGETVLFNVRVTNNGPLNLTSVKLKIEGQNGATVRPGLGSAFEPSFISAELPFIGADGGSDILSRPAFEAPARDQESKTLVSVSIHDYKASLNHILEERGGPRPQANAVYAAEVSPS